MQDKNGKLWSLFLVVLVGALIYYLTPIMLPFLISALLAYLSNPLIKYLMKFKIPRLPAVIIVFFGLFFFIIFFILLLIPFLHKQVAALNVQLPNMIAWIQERIAPFNKYIPGDLFSSDNIKEFLSKNVGKTGGAALFLLHSGKAALEILLNIILIPIVTFYLMRDWDAILLFIKDAVPSRMRPTVVKLAIEIDAVLSAFFRGTLLIMVILAIYYSIALSLIGLQLGVTIGVVVGLTSIVPYLGLVIGITFAIIATLMQFGTLYSVLLVVLVFLIGHATENFYLTPNLIGNRIGLHPVLVIFSILAGGALFGFFGVLLALPVAAVLLVLLRYFANHYREKRLQS